MPYQGLSDDSAIHGLSIQCQTRYGYYTNVFYGSRLTYYGVYPNGPLYTRLSTKCNDINSHTEGFLKAVRIRSLRFQGGSDDYGTTNVEMKCNDEEIKQERCFTKGRQSYYSPFYFLFYQKHFHFRVI